jgi:hypothetical protein
MCNLVAHRNATSGGSNGGVGVTRDVAGDQAELDAHMEDLAILADYPAADG